MRGSVQVETLINDTDVEDLEIIGQIVKENVDNVKKTGMAII